MRLVREPIYQQLSARLRELALAMGCGARFPSERELAVRFGVSRATTNKAVAALVGEGVLENRKGVGTFVARSGARVPMRYDLRSLVSFTERARASGRVPTTRVLRFEEGEPPGVVRETLGEGAMVHVVRLRLADGEPLILEDRWVVRGLCPGLTVGDVMGSLYGYLVDKLGLEVTGSDQTVTAVGLTAGEAGLLEQVVGAPALCVTAVGRVLSAGGLSSGGGRVPDVGGSLGAGERRLWWERTLYRSDRYVFEASLSGLGGGGVVVERRAGVSG